MTVSYEQAKRLLSELTQTPLLHSSDTHIVLCPSFPALSLFSDLARESNVALGAQDCSPFSNGPYTGDVDALSLKQIGCTYCIVGHSERRRIYKESPELVAQKVAQLQLNQIIPIVCIGESAEEKETGTTISVLQKQLLPVLTVSAGTQGALIIAYEPVWAIGSGKQPSIEELAEIVRAIKTFSATILSTPITVLYGGSVTAETIGQIKKAPDIEGVLIGSASTDFHSLQKIVS